MALLVKVPIFAAPEVFEQARDLVFTAETAVFGLEAIYRKRVEEKRALLEEVEMEWRLFRSLPRGYAVATVKPAEE